MIKQKIFLLKVKNCTSVKLQIISDQICEDLNVRKIKIAFHGKQPLSGRRKVLGTYRRGVAVTKIQVYQYTAKQLKQIATKTAFETLLHELCHHYDYELLNLTKSIHCAGFFKRISNLKMMLMS